MTRDGLLEYAVADPVHLRDGEQQQSEQDPAGRGSQPRRPAPEPVGEVLSGVQDADERDPDAGRQDPEAGVQDELQRRGEVEARERQERLRAERGAPDCVGSDGAEYDVAERLGVEVAQDQLEREEHSGDRRVERRRYSRGGAARDEQAQTTLRYPGELTEDRPQRRADLHDRAFTADRAARADA